MAHPNSKEKKNMEKIVDFDDLSELCTATQETDGVWVAVELYGRKYNLRALVYGETSDSVQKFQRNKLRKQMKNLNIRSRGGKVDIDDDGIEDVVNDDGIDAALVRLGGLSRLDGSPLKFGGKNVPVTREGESVDDIYRGILRGTPELSDFILKVARDRAYFLPERKKS
ncbi:MAG: hypothetical protein IKP60_07200 [Treponema sp.]|nr:hypothetical protein [Treponema sp.]